MHSKIRTLRAALGQRWFFCRELWHWFRLRRFASRVSSLDATPGVRCLIVPCDPWSVVGSRGDQAMILAAMQHLRAKAPETTFSVLACGCAPEEKLRQLGLKLEPHWDDGTFWAWTKGHLAAFDRVCLLGADVTDGVYGWNTALRLQALYDLFSRVGAKTHYFGFSFSTHPHPWMRWVFALQRRGLPLPVRDPVSLRRLFRFTRHRPVRLVADVAFCMAPRMTPRTECEAVWCDEQHVRNRRVLAVNLHQMFNGEIAHGAAWETAVASVLIRLMEEIPDVALLLLPHDDRPGISDDGILRRLKEAFPSALSDKIRLVGIVLDADESKALLAHCDALMAGRMHLSIAALGQRVPVFALVYQGKFEGLWEHFGLPSETLCAPERFLTESEAVYAAVVRFMENLSSLRAHITDMLPRVLELSAGQFEWEAK